MKKERKEKEWDREVSRQISVYKTQSALLELNNCLSPASALVPWHIHAQGREDEGGRSLIRAVMVDYSRKDSSFSVYANLAPELVKYLFAKIQQGAEEFAFFQQKIFRGDNTALREGMVTCFSMKRCPYDPAGNPRRMPWVVEIQNGSGRIAYNSTGGQFCEKGSYRKEKSISVSLKDEDIFMLFSRADSVIRLFEQDTVLGKKNARNFQKLYQLMESLILRDGKNQKAKETAA